MDIENTIKELRNRNSRVEIDKAWETSYTRRISISIITYVVAVLWLYLINESGIWLKSVVPVAGYILSTISIPQIRKIWLENNDLRQGK
jgi:hypothetical protein